MTGKKSLSLVQKMLKAKDEDQNISVLPEDPEVLNGAKPKKSILWNFLSGNFAESVKKSAEQEGAMYKSLKNRDKEKAGYITRDKTVAIANQEKETEYQDAKRIEIEKQQEHNTKIAKGKAQEKIYQDIQNGESGSSGGVTENFFNNLIDNETKEWIDSAKIQREYRKRKTVLQDADKAAANEVMEVLRTHGVNVDDIERLNVRTFDDFLEYIKHIGLSEHKQQQIIGGIKNIQASLEAVKGKYLNE